MCGAHNVNKADRITCTRTFREVRKCNRSRREQTRTCVLKSPQPISNQDLCSLAWFCI
ncbi:unnamed protein product [Hymenolepis diminuta]|uniref:Uncharacterized protein n=1 Tax=Hymenolepis diminuta TaxID=6216 RepID=A0A564YEA3_HYMDI|nr:unnamed protein product [Hymenolepis diminuta]